MKIAVIGSGYVGLVAGTCFADLGNQVMGVDIDEKKVAMLGRGESPIYEPGLSELLVKNLKKKRLTFTSDLAGSIRKAKYIFIAVGTPPGPTGAANLRFVWAVARSIGKYINGPKIIVDKSTVPIGTGDRVAAIIRAEQRKRKTKYKFSVVSNPEFLREGCALNDFMEPDRVVLGADAPAACREVARLYQPLKANIIMTDLRSAEMIKYAANAFLSTKISFINEMANICEAVGADIKSVAEGIGADHRINHYFLNAGIGYGGSCFPKDVDALEALANKLGCATGLLAGVRKINQGQRKKFIAKIRRTMPRLKGKRIGVLGLAFKPDTDDMREAPALTILPALLRAGAVVKAYDPVAIENARALLPKKVVLCSTAEEAIAGADALLLLTEWNEFKELDFKQVRRTMRGRHIFDGRNLYDLEEVRVAGLSYHGVGRCGKRRG